MFRQFLASLLLLAAVIAPARAQENATSSQKTAIFAGGCFWCMQPPFDKTKGVTQTVVGYSGGEEVNPTYDQVSNKKTGHREVIQVTYDPAQVTYAELVEIFWQNINPTQADGQFADIGLPYQSAIFYTTGEEKQIAEASKQKLAQSGKFQKPIVTPILPVQPFYAAEDYHQKYYEKNPGPYQAYSVGSGRAGFLARTWGKPDAG
ncbi:peptide-methionine (S)-S-oxide reductase MsrA [soil metagenome]